MNKFILVFMGICCIIATVGAVLSVFYSETEGITFGMVAFAVIMNIVTSITANELNN